MAAIKYVHAGQFYNSGIMQTQINREQKMVKLMVVILLFSSFGVVSTATGIELVIGEQRIEPGIVFIFEGAIKDRVIPASMHLPEEETHVHIEARVNWDDQNIPAGTPPGGFVPYLRISAKVTNQNTKLMSYIDLLPHINLVDNFHYARNMALPGDIGDLYSVSFTVARLSHDAVALHKDWLDSYGTPIVQDQVFEYTDVDFSEIANASRR